MLVYQPVSMRLPPAHFGDASPCASPAQQARYTLNAPAPRSDGRSRGALHSCTSHNARVQCEVCHRTIDRHAAHSAALLTDPSLVITRYAPFVGLRPAL